MRLVVQSPHLTHGVLKQLAALAGIPANWTPITPQAYYTPIAAPVPAVYTPIAAPVPAVQAFCQQQGVDCAFVDDAHRLDHIKLCVMDMDSTLINIECIDEIAAMAGLKPQIAAITERAMQGELDFAQSLRARVTMLKGVSEADLERVLNEKLRLSDGAEQWLATCKQHGIYTVLVSGGFTFFAERVQAMLGLDEVVSNRLELRNGKLTGQLLGELVDAPKKAQVLLDTAQRLGIDREHTLAIGDGANDIPLLQCAGISIAYHAKPLVRQQARYVLDRVGLGGVVALFSTQ